jgi:hypothetical protein
MMTGDMDVAMFDCLALLPKPCFGIAQDVPSVEQKIFVTFDLSKVRYITKVDYLENS